MLATTSIATLPRVRFRCLMWSALIVLCIIGAAAALRRMIALAYPPHNAPPELAALDAVFASRPLLTLSHIVPGLIFMLLVPFQFSRSFRNRHLEIHRWMGRAIIILGLVVGISALPMSSDAIGGRLKIAAILTFDTLFLLSLTTAFLHIRRGNVVQHREWIIRAMSIALGIATVRPIMGIFFAMRHVTRLTPHDFFGIAFWTGFTLTWVAGELWIRYTRNVQPRTQVRAPVIWYLTEDSQSRAHRVDLCTMESP